MEPELNVDKRFRTFFIPNFIINDLLLRILTVITGCAIAQAVSCGSIPDSSPGQVMWDLWWTK
jgi:hypothetical protein